MAQKNGTGMFPREVMNRFPLLPLEEEGRLNDMPDHEKSPSECSSTIAEPRHWMSTDPPAPACRATRVVLECTMFSLSLFAKHHIGNLDRVERRMRPCPF